MTKELTINIPEKLVPLFTTDKRFIAIKGGRGSAKSWTVADFLLLKAYESKKRVLCTREIQKSIRDSVHKLLTDRIAALGLGGFYTITEKSIVGLNGSNFLFKGLRHNPDDIKSTEGVDYAWVEEAQSVSRKSHEILTPTIRTPNSQIIYTYNHTNPDDPVDVDYYAADRDDVERIFINFTDNPFFPDTLRAEMEYIKRVDYDKYLHIWEGQPVQHSEAQVFFGKWSIDRFDTPEDVFFYFGADWGFSTDPTALVRCYIRDNVLYIDREGWGLGVDIDKTPELFDTVPMSRKYPIIADSARPETISHMNNNGFRVVRSKKGKGSVEDGISKIRGFEKIIIHEDCTRTIDEFRNYHYKVDPITGAVSTVLVDKHNHLIDALRYALEGLNEYAGVVRWGTTSKMQGLEV